MIILRHLRRGESGQALIEFALIAVFLILLIVGFLELVLLVHTYNVLADAAKEGVRYAIVHGATNNGGGSGPTCPCATIDGAPGTGVVRTYAQYSLHNVTAMTATCPTGTPPAGGYVCVDYNPGGNNGATACNKSPCLVRVTVGYPYRPFFNLGWMPTINVYAASQGRIIF